MTSTPQFPSLYPTTVPDFGAENRSPVCRSPSGARLERGNIELHTYHLATDVMCRYLDQILSELYRLPHIGQSSLQLWRTREAVYLQCWVVYSYVQSFSDSSPRAQLGLWSSSNVGRGVWAGPSLSLGLCVRVAVSHDRAFRRAPRQVVLAQLLSGRRVDHLLGVVRRIVGRRGGLLSQARKHRFNPVQPVLELAVCSASPAGRCTTCGVAAAEMLSHQPR